MLPTCACTGLYVHAACTLEFMRWKAYAYVQGGRGASLVFSLKLGVNPIRVQ